MCSASRSSGNGCSESVGVYRVTAVTQWLRTNGYRGFLGEFGAAPTQTCYRAVDNLLTYLGENSDVWFGCTWWAAGPWWGDYPMSIEPIDGTEDAPMTTLLERHLTAP